MVEASTQIDCGEKKVPELRGCSDRGPEDSSERDLKRWEERRVQEVSITPSPPGLKLLVRLSS
jgi:hypothetical protein